MLHFSAYHYMNNHTYSISGSRGHSDRKTDWRWSVFCKSTCKSTYSQWILPGGSNNTKGIKMQARVRNSVLLLLVIPIIIPNIYKVGNMEEVLTVWLSQTNDISYLISELLARMVKLKLLSNLLQNTLVWGRLLLDMIRRSFRIFQELSP